MRRTRPSTFEGADVVATRARRDEWMSSRKPSAPLVVIRRVRAGDSWLKAFRSHRGITQAELAKKAGIAQGYLIGIETDRKAPSAEARSALAAALDIHPVVLSDNAPAIDLRADA